MLTKLRGADALGKEVSSVTSKNTYVIFLPPETDCYDALGARPSDILIMHTSGVAPAFLVLCSLFSIFVSDRCRSSGPSMLRTSPLSG